MRKNKNFLIGFTMLILCSFIISGCAVNLYKQSPNSRKKILALQSEIDSLEKERRREGKEFEDAMRELESKLKKQISDKQVSLRMGDEGLAIILSDNILFDSGKAEIKSKAYSVLDKVAVIIKKEVPDKNIGITGHTDNVPITHSNWDSNWELSTARATNVLHYLAKKGVPTDRLSATGYGDTRPIASNATEAGRARNRRVEIVILPKHSEKRAGEEEEYYEEEFVK